MARIMSTVVALSFAWAHGAGAQSADGGDFCDTGYQKVDTDQDGIITEEEWRVSAEAMFALLDEDDSGEITRAEFSDCFGRLAMRQSAAVSDRSESNMRAADTDGNGVIDETEFMEAGEAVRTGIDETSETGGSADDAPSQRDGTPSQDGEAGSALGSDDPATAEPELGAPAGGTGTDLDRFVDAPLAGADDAEEMSAEEFAARAARTFNSLDRNRDGYLSGEEWSQASAMRSDITQQLDRLFEQLDADESEGIDREEYLADSRERFEAAKADDAAADSDGVPILVYYRYQFGL